MNESKPNRNEELTLEFIDSITKLVEYFNKGLLSEKDLDEYTKMLYHAYCGATNKKSII